MSSELDNTFNAIDRMLDLTPFFRCPHCNLRDEEGTFFNLSLPGRVAVTVRDAEKVFEFREDEIEYGLPGSPDAREYFVLVCDSCQQDFPLPDGWRIQER